MGETAIPVDDISIKDGVILCNFKACRWLHERDSRYPYCCWFNFQPQAELIFVDTLHQVPISSRISVFNLSYPDSLEYVIAEIKRSYRTHLAGNYYY